MRRTAGGNAGDGAPAATTFAAETVQFTADRAKPPQYRRNACVRFDDLDEPAESHKTESFGDHVVFPVGGVNRRTPEWQADAPGKTVSQATREGGVAIILRQMRGDRSPTPPSRDARRSREGRP